MSLKMAMLERLFRYFDSVQQLWVLLFSLLPLGIKLLTFYASWLSILQVGRRNQASQTLRLSLRLRQQQQLPYALPQSAQH